MRAPKRVKHRYAQMNTDDHRWDSAIVAARVMAKFSAAAIRSAYVRVKALSSQIEPVQNSPPVIASEAKQSASREVCRLLRFARNDRDAQWANLILNRANGIASKIGFESCAFRGGRLVAILCISLIAFTYWQICV